MAFRSRNHARRGVGSGIEFEAGAAACVFAVIASLVIAGNVAPNRLPEPAGAPPVAGVSGSPPGSLNGTDGNSTLAGANSSSTPGVGSGGGNVSIQPNGSSSGGPGTGNTGSGGPQWPVAGVAGSLVPGSAAGTVTPAFFELDIQTPNLTSPWLWGLLNQTPFTYYSFGDAGEATNQVTGTQYASNGSALAPSKANDTNFIAFCRELHCHAIMAVPAEIDNTTQDAATVAYIEDTLGFHPDYWAIGNEPQSWSHFGIPWTSWRPTDASNITPLGYAREVQGIVSAVHGVDPAAKILGIESADGGSYNDSQWLDEVAAVDGPNLTALAIHPYPDGAGPANPTNASFFAGLSSDIRFPNNFNGLSASVQEACQCSLPIWVGEYNSALNGSYAPFEDGYPEVAYMAAGIAGSLRAGITHEAFFALQHPPAMLIGADGSTYPIYTLFSTFLKNLTFGTVYSSSVQTELTGVFAVVTANASRTTLLVVNTNTTGALNLSLPASYLGGAVSAWAAYRWGPQFPAPVVSDVSGDPAAYWEIPSQGVWMLNLTT